MPPPPHKNDKNSPSAMVQGRFVTSAVDEMLTAGAISILLKRERLQVVSPLGVVPTGKREKCRIVINMRYVNEYLAN